jgi:hypothetical protein
MFSGFFFIVTFLFSNSLVYVEILGFLSLSIEATLGLPQLYKNYVTNSTQGLSMELIASWFVGDAFKTVYFLISGAPVQFIFCGVFQLIVDVAITYQLYAIPSTEGARKSPVNNGM